MFSGMIFIIAPLIVGYLLPHLSEEKSHKINKATELLVFIILFLMGLSLASLDNLNENFQQIVLYASTFFVCIGAANLLSLPIIDKFIPIESKGKKSKINLLSMILESSKLIGSVVAGLVIGLIFNINQTPVDSASEIILMVLLFLIGIQLKNSGLTLKTIILNKHGLVIASMVVVSALLGGLLAAYILNLPPLYGLAMASGFGWYSLAGILMGDALGPIYGGSAFILELARELFAIILITLLMHRYPATGIGYAGATAMDFTLPVIKTTGGINVVPIAIVSGFTLSLMVPFLMLFFLSLI
jgi:uncharacterized membrane protein YbjE (DUF340 family)